MFSLDVRIMSVPERAAAALALVERLVPQVREATDAGYRVSMPVVERGVEPRGPWWGNARCWQSVIASGASHGLVLNDDIRCCADLVLTACQLAEVVGDAVVTFATTCARHLNLVRLGAGCAPLAWLVATPYCTGWANLMPVAIAGDGLAWIEAQPSGRWAYPENDDPKWRAYFAAAGTRVLLTVPNLVEHPDELPTTIQHRCAEKVHAAWYAGDDFCAAGLAWNKI